MKSEDVMTAAMPSHRCHINRHSKRSSPSGSAPDLPDRGGSASDAKFKSIVSRCGRRRARSKLTSKSARSVKSSRFPPPLLARDGKAASLCNRDWVVGGGGHASFCPHARLVGRRTDDAWH